MRPWPRLRLRGQLLLLTPLLLLVPWLVLNTVDEMGDFVLSGQREAERLAAQAVATVLHGRDELFAGTGRQFAPSEVLYAFPLEQNVLLDGYDDEWRGIRPYGRRFSAATGAVAPTAMTIWLGSRGEYVHAFIAIEDDVLVYRHPRYRRLDHCDALRLSFITDDGSVDRILVLTDGPGTMSAYRVGEDWAHAVDGRPLAAIRAVWREIAAGYAIELRLPRSWLDRTQRLRLAIADVDDAVQRHLRTVVASGGKQGMPVVLRSIELERILRGLRHASTRIRIVDGAGRVWAETGDWSHRPVMRLRRDGPIGQALNGQAAVATMTGLDGGLIMAAHPIRGREGVLGAVVVEQRLSDVLTEQRVALWRLGLMTFATLIAIIAGLWLLAARLGFRIHRLSHEAQMAIAPDGRIVRTEIKSERAAGDEIGELSRAITALLGRLQVYTHFLEQMPPILRHEIENPLSTIQMYLDKLDETGLRTLDTAGLAAARRAVVRITHIVRSVTEAASLEEALYDEQRHPVDLAALVDEYLASCRERHTACRFSFEVEGEGFIVEGSDQRIEQMLDRLVENAVDFCPAGAAIRCRIARAGAMLRLSLANPTTDLPGDDELASLFDPLRSYRHTLPTGPGHLGIGLYVVRLIAESFGGKAEAIKSVEPRELTIVIEIPAAGQ